MQVIHLRGRGLRRAISALFALLATVAGLTLLVQLLLSAVGSGSVDSGWFAVVVVCAVVAFLLRRSEWVLELLAISGDSAHRARFRFVWGLLLFGVVLVAGLKLGSADQHAYKKLVFGEGGLVEWTQVLLLVTAVRLSLIHI